MDTDDQKGTELAALHNNASAKQDDFKARKRARSTAVTTGGDNGKPDVWGLGGPSVVCMSALLHAYLLAADVYILCQ